MDEYTLERKYAEGNTNDGRDKSFGSLLLMLEDVCQLLPLRCQSIFRGFRLIGLSVLEMSEDNQP